MAKVKKNNDEPRRGLFSGWRNWLYDPRVIIACVGICAAPFLANMARKSGTDFTTLPQYQVDRREVKLTELPTFVPVDLLERTWQRAGLEPTFSLLEPQLAERIGKAFELSPWVREVKHIRLRYPNKIEIGLEYREPVALVQLQQGYYPVDRDGILLPPMDFSIKQLGSYPAVEGIDSVPRGPAGDHWGDLAVWGATRLAEMMLAAGDKDSPWKRFHFKTIRVEGHSATGIRSIDDLNQVQYRLITDKGSEVIWGVAPDVPDPTEPNAETKLKRLEMYFRDFGGLQTAQGPVEIDLRRWKDIARRPLPSPDGRVTR
ncbi:cell division protein FtsQ/DivIB [Rubinisphaera margarita]|uniref:cell division protein FtsQ/DivIB n=1 Tax=Rubinisphaera margarita TaxID=2909586 RepID=UPI001EE7A573|nr:hypothetical protein [Rubinisphaera margarita]MCG6156609.1 hypothetical protein [Rubinisphaera margarita]